MRFNPKARLDTGRIGSSGAGRTGGGMRIPSSRGRGGTSVPLPRGRMSIGALLVIGLVYLAVQFLLPALSDGYSASRFSDEGDPERYAGCRTGEDANQKHDCARVAVENSLHDFWGDQLGDRYRPITTLTTFRDQIRTGCGGATSDVGPFYCPADEGIYLDTTFFDQVLEKQLDGPRGAFVEFYVLAHEYGHHISHLLGFMGQVRSQQGPQSDATRLELQADCYAGMWAHHATTTEDADGTVLIEDLTRDDVRLALDAAAAVGDDHIQRKTQGQTNPETWNHGSSEQRMRWFTVGYEQGSLDACDTFAAERV